MNARGFGACLMIALGGYVSVECRCASTDGGGTLTDAASTSAQPTGVPTTGSETPTSEAELPAPSDSARWTDEGPWWSKRARRLAGDAGASEAELRELKERGAKRPLSDLEGRRLEALCRELDAQCSGPPTPPGAK